GGRALARSNLQSILPFLPHFSLRREEIQAESLECDRRNGVVAAAAECGASADHRQWRPVCQPPFPPPHHQTGCTALQQAPAEIADEWPTPGRGGMDGSPPRRPGG